MGRHRDMRQNFDLQAVASSGAVVTCAAGTFAPRLKWPHLAPVTGHLCVCVSGVVRISTDGLPHVKQRLVAPGAVSSVSISVDIYWYLLISIDIYWIYESIRCDDNFGAEDNFLLIPYTTEVVSGAKDPRRNLRKTHHVRMHRTPWASAHPMQIRVSTHLIHSCHTWRGHSLARAVY